MAKVIKSHHVVPAIDGGWAVVKTSADRASRVFDTQEAAISWGRTQSIKSRTRLVIHRRDGTVALKAAYSNEPHPQRNRKK